MAQAAPATSAGAFPTIKRRGGERIGSALREHLDSAPSSPLHASSPLFDPVAQSNEAPAGRYHPMEGSELPRSEPVHEMRDATGGSVHGRLEPPPSSHVTAPGASKQNEKARPKAAAAPGTMAFPARQRTDSRPTTSPRAAMLAAAAANASTLPRCDGEVSQPFPDTSSSTLDRDTLPSALHSDSRHSVRRALGKRAESESAYTTSALRSPAWPPKQEKGRSKDDTDGLAEEKRTDILQGKHSRSGSSITSSLRRLMRRTSMRGKSQSISSLATVASPSRSFRELYPDLEVEDRTSLGELRESTDLRRSRKESMHKVSSKDAKGPFLFAPFRARDASQANKAKAKSGPGLLSSSGIATPLWKKDRIVDGDESFGNSGPLEQLSGLPKPSRDLPYSFRAARPEPTSSAANVASSPLPNVDRDEMNDTQHASRSADPLSKDTTAALAPVPCHDASARTSHESIEQLDNGDGTPRPVPREFEGSQSQRPLSDLTIRTDEGMGVALDGRGASDLNDSLAMNSLTASGRQPPEPSGAEAVPSVRAGQSGQPSKLTSNGSSHLMKPRVGIPRIWQGIELAESPSAPTFANLEDERAERVASGSTESRSNSRFDTVTTTSSFKTAESSLGSPRPSWLHAPRPGSRPSLPTLDLASQTSRRFDQDRGFESPLSDLITSLEQRFDGRSTSTPAAYFDAYSESSESPTTRDFLPALAAGPSPEPEVTASSSASVRDVSTAETSGPSSLRAESISASTPIDAADDARRNTFGEMDRLAGQPSAGKSTSSRLSDEESGDDLPRQIDVSEIEDHLAAVEAALQEQYIDRSTLSARTIGDRAIGDRTGDRATLHDDSDFSMVAEQGSFSLEQGASHGADVSMPGAWSSSLVRPFPKAEEPKLAIAPGSQKAIADAVRQVRRAISSSQLQRRDSSSTEVESRSGDTEMERRGTTDAEADEGIGDETRDRCTQLAGDTTLRSEATPVRAAKRRWDSMRDIEESYGRMLALVQSSAIGATPSPVMKNDANRFGDRTPHRRSKRDPLSQSMQESQQESPLLRSTAQAAERRERTKSTPVGQPLQILAAAKPPSRALGARFMGQRTRGHSRTNSQGVEVPASNSLSGLMGMPRDEAAWHLRGRTSSSSMGSARRVASESPVRLPRIDSPSLLEQNDPKRHSAGAQAPDAHRQAQILAQSKERLPSQPHQQQRRESDLQWKRSSNEPTVPGLASSGAGGTSPSASAKTLGTPRSQLAEPTAATRQSLVGAWDEAASAGQRASYPRNAEPATLLQAIEAHSERERLGEGHVRGADRSFSVNGSHERHAGAVPSRSPIFESQPPSLSHHAADGTRSAEGHSRRRSKQLYPAPVASGSSRPVGAMSPAPSLASGVRGRYELGSIRDWSSQVGYRPSSSRSGTAAALAHQQREENNSTMGTSEYDALAALGVVPPSSAPHGSVVIMMRRHELERESLLDSLERTRAEVAELRARNDSLTADLHAEVTRVLELERELERRDDRELQLIARAQQLESELDQLVAGAHHGLAETPDSRSPAERQPSASPALANGIARASPEHSLGGPHKVSSFGKRPCHRSTLSEVALPAVADSTTSSTRQEMATSPRLPIPRLSPQNGRARPVSLFSGPGGLTTIVAPALQRQRLGDSSTAMAAASSEQRLLQQAEAEAEAGSSKPSGLEGSKQAAASPKLRTYPSLLGLNLDAEEADWALADEQPPEETSRDSIDDSRGDLSSFLANYTEAGQGRSVEFPTMSSPKLSSTAASSSSMLPSASSTLGSNNDEAAPSVTATVTVQTQPAGPPVHPPERSSSIGSPLAGTGPGSSRGHRRVPGSLGVPSSSSLPRLAATTGSPSQRTTSAASSVRSTSSRLHPPGSLSGIPFGLSTRNASSATTRSNYTHASTYTARSDSPVGSFVTNWRGTDAPLSPERRRTSHTSAAQHHRTPHASASTSGATSRLASTGPSAPRGGLTGGPLKRGRVGGYYDPRRPGDYDPHALPATHEALLDGSFSSVGDEGAPQRGGGKEMGV